jgi:diaminohydroxyphosphoribosylaminopyrimidine deaminase/5-amino-6-(5-phosphoribosylamino)uracil reductase
MKNIPILTEKTISEIEKSLKKRAQAKYLETGIPFVTLKFVQTLDGKIATAVGDSRWISGAFSLRFAHQLRSFHHAVLVGVETIIRDNPQLTVRLVKGKNPKKIIIDGQLRTPLDSNILKGKAALSTIIATTSLSEVKKIKDYQSKGAKVWVLKKDIANQVDLQNLLQELGKRDIRSILVEGGSKVIHSFMEKRLVDWLFIILAPKIIGKGLTGLDIPVSQKFEYSSSFSSPRFLQSGNDIILSMSVH